MMRISNEWELQKLKRILARVNALAPQMKSMDDAALRGMTGVFKDRIQQGESLDSLLPEAFAVCREAAGRVLGMYPYDVQVLGAIALHQGKIAEMKTGEGKTLVATMPLYLNALTGKSCILVTMNSYLAVRDGTQMGQLYRWLGLTCGIGTSDDEKARLSDREKRAVYHSDIVYTTNVALGFDYLLENLKTSPSQRYLRPFSYIIIDEADSVLLDSAVRPLIISGAPTAQSGLYAQADYFVTTLTPGEDYQKEDLQVWLTPSGVHRAEVFFGMSDLYTAAHFEIVHHIILALRAHAIYERDKQYVVEDRHVYLLDSQTGRIMPNVKLRTGQHQALEAKEHVPFTEDNRSMAFITYQDFFGMFPKKAGMTGTGEADAGEFRQNYGLPVVGIPTRKKIERRDYPDRIFSTKKAQVQAAMQEIIQVHYRQEPVLVITDSIALSDTFSRLLLSHQIPHNVLNAYNTAKEADIIREAGRKGAVTVATAVAGRGTDIKLGEGVRELGGLAVIGVCRMENRRLELQARGRAGRQGDPGYSRFYVSMEDQVVRDFGKPYPKSLMGYEGEITGIWYAQRIRDAQLLCEAQNREGRRTTASFGRSMRYQRERIYAQRNRIMDSTSADPAPYLQMEQENIRDFLQKFPEGPRRSDVIRYLCDHVSYDIPLPLSGCDFSSPEGIEAYLLSCARKVLGEKCRLLAGDRARSLFFNTVALHVLDEAWIGQVDYLQQLRTVLQGRQYARRNVLYEYHLEAAASYDRMQKRIRTETLRCLLQCTLFPQKDGTFRILYP